MKKIIILFLTVVSLLSLVSCSKNDSVKDYITIEVEGFNGYGLFSHTIDTSKLGDNTRIDCVADKKNHLKNGDVVTLACEITTQNKANKEQIELITSEETVTYTVSGLKEVDLVKLSDIYEFIFCGIDGQGKLIAKTKDDIGNELNLYADFYKKNDDGTYEKTLSDSSCKNGDKVSVYTLASDPDEFYEKHNALPDPTPIELEVSGLGKIIETYEEFPETLINAIKDASYNKVMSDADKYAKLECNFYGDVFSAYINGSNNLILYFECNIEEISGYTYSEIRCCEYFDVFYSDSNPLGYTYVNDLSKNGFGTYDLDWAKTLVEHNRQNENCTSLYVSWE